MEIQYPLKEVGSFLEGEKRPPNMQCYYCELTLYHRRYTVTVLIVINLFGIHVVQTFIFRSACHFKLIKQFPGFNEFTA